MFLAGCGSRRLLQPIYSGALPSQKLARYEMIWGSCWVIAVDVGDFILLLSLWLLLMMLLLTLRLLMMMLMFSKWSRCKRKDRQAESKEGMRERGWRVQSKARTPIEHYRGKHEVCATRVVFCVVAVALYVCKVFSFGSTNCFLYVFVCCFLLCIWDIRWGGAAGGDPAPPMLTNKWVHIQSKEIKIHVQVLA